MPKSFRNSFTSGFLDALAAARSDLSQYPKGLRQALNIILLAHGGFRRRPGSRFARKLTGLGSPEYPGRLARFRFNLEQQYLLHFRDNRLDVYRGDDRITRIKTPWENADIPGLYLSPKAQTADTRVICSTAPDGTTNFADYAPRRLLRSPLRNPNAIATTSGSTVVRVYQTDHFMLDGDDIGLSDLEAVGGVSADRLNSFQDVITYEDNKNGNAALGTDPLYTFTTTILELDLGFAHAYQTGDRIRLRGFTAFALIPAEQINRVQAITAASTNKIQFKVESTGVIATHGGGSAGHWKAESFYSVDVGGSTSGITTTTGGGTAGRSWLLHSLAPDVNRRVAFTHLPQFDFQDSLSPPPKSARQRLVFTSWLAGEDFDLEIQIPGSPGFASYTLKTGELTWAANPADNAGVMQSAISSGFTDETRGVTVTFVTEAAGGPAPPSYAYDFVFDGALAYPPIQVLKVHSLEGTIVHDDANEVAGGSTEEDVISNVRGWPSGAIFYQRRLWLFGIYARPATILASETEEFFRFEVGSALDSSAIDATGEFDPIRHLVAERGLVALTTASEVPITGGVDDVGITPTNITLKVASRYGSASVPPVSIAGRPIYTDRIGRAIRQLGFSQDTGAIESTDISILSQSLIRTPVAMEVWRNALGDYVCVVNADGTMAVLCINQDQGVAGWVPWSTDGSYLDVCEVDDLLYYIVKRHVDGSDVYYLESFNFALFTDSALSVEDQVARGDVADFFAGSRDDVGGYAHLKGRTVQVRGNETTCESAVVTDSGHVTPMTGDVIFRAIRVDAGLAIPLPVGEPNPPQLSEQTSVVRAAIDLFEARGVYVNGFKLREYLPGQPITNAAAPLITGIRPLELRGWGERLSVVITMPEPQPCTVRAIEMEVA